MNIFRFRFTLTQYALLIVSTLFLMQSAMADKGTFVYITNKSGYPIKVTVSNVYHMKKNVQRLSIPKIKNNETYQRVYIEDSGTFIATSSYTLTFTSLGPGGGRTFFYYNSAVPPSSGKTTKCLGDAGAFCFGWDNYIRFHGYNNSQLHIHIMVLPWI